MAGNGNDPAAAATDEGMYYVVKMAGNGSVCVVHGDQLRAGGGGEVGVGATCEVGEGGETKSAIVIGAGSESALSLLENCIKQATPIAPPPIVSEEVGVSSQSGGGTRGGLWGSELAALLSPTNPPSNPPSNKGTTGTKRSPVAMEMATKRRKLEVMKQPASVVRSTALPTVIPSKPVVVGGVKSTTPSRAGTPAGGGAVGGAKPSGGEVQKLSREIEPPPRPAEKTDPLSQILHEVKEIRRSYSTLAGSMLIIRRNQEDIKNRLTEIGLSIVTNSSDPLILTSDPSPREPSGDYTEVATTGLGSMERVEIVPGEPDHPHTLRGINLAATFPEFDPEYLVVSRGKSCSRRNFAVNLVRYLFTAEEMAQSNCSGTRGKGKLEQERLAIVRRTTLTLWPVEDRLQERAEWAKCIYSIDEACRRLNRPKLKKREAREEDELALETEVESFMVGGASQI